MPINLSSVDNKLGSLLQNSESDLDSTIKATRENPTQQDLMSIQRKMTTWSLLTQLESNIAKAVGDALKSIAQKIG